MTDDSIGIDISKDRLDAVRLSDGGGRSFSNDARGFRALRTWLRAAPPARVVYASTGPYHAAFECACTGHLPLCKVNPLQARRFAQARGVPAKTDLVDARMLAAMGAAFALEPDRPAPAGQHDLKELQVERCALVRDRTRLLNRLKTQTLALTRRQTRARLAQAERQIAATQAEIEIRLRARRARPALHSRHRSRHRGCPSDRMPRNRHARPQASRQPRRPRAHGSPIRTMAGACLHTGRTQAVA